jgi:hypothetical protein
MGNEKDSNRELAHQRLNTGKDPGPLDRISLLSYGFFFGAIGGHSAKFGDWFTIFASAVLLVNLLVNLFRYLSRKTKPETAP